MEVAPSKGIAVLGHFLLTSPVLPPAPGSAAPALLSLSHPPCALFSLPTLNWCCPARPGSFPGFALSVESGEDSESLSACLRAPSTPSIPQAPSWSCRLVPALVPWICGGLGMLQGSQGGDRSCVYPQCFTQGQPSLCSPHSRAQGRGMAVLPWDGAGKRLCVDPLELTVAAVIPPMQEGRQQVLGERGGV